MRRCRIFGKSPALLDPHIHVHSPRTAGLGPAAKSQLLEKGLNLHGDVAHVRPTDAWSRIEIDTQFIRMFEITRTRRVWMKFDAAEVDDPGQTCGIVDDDFFRCAAGWEGERHRSQPVRPRCGCAFLIKRLPFGTIDKAL